MNVKLISSIAGDRFVFAPRQVIKCSERAGARLISEGVAVAADPKAEVEGEMFDHAPEERVAPRRPPERAVKEAPETPEKGEASAICQGTTMLGNDCKKKAMPGSKFCATHQEG